MSPLRPLAVSIAAVSLAACSSNVQRFDYHRGDNGRPYARLGVPSRIVATRAGDTLPTVAARYDTDVQTLRALNGLKSDKLAAGQEIAVPYHRP
jgi:hypothetical protein